MNKKLSLFLASSIVSAVLIMNCGAADASVSKQTSDGAIIETYGFGYERELNHISQLSLPKLEKYYRKFELCIKNSDFNRAEEFSIEYIAELVNAQQNNKAEFYKSFSKTVNLLQETSNKYPLNPFPLCCLAKLYQISEDYDTAFDLIRECIKLDKKNALYKYELASLYMDTNQYEKAIRIFEQLKMQYPREKEFRVALAAAYQGLGMYNDAVREYRVAVAFEPEDNDTVAALVSASTYSQFISKNQPFYDPMTAVSSRPATTATAANQNVIAFGSNNVQSFSSSNAYTTSIKDAKGKNVVAKSSPSVKTATGNQSQVPVFQSQAQPAPAVHKTGVAEVSDRYQTVSSQETSVSNEPVTQQNGNVYNLTNNSKAARVQNNSQPMALKQKQPKTPRSASSNKRVMVSYINGRKVVKIVNISQDNDVSQTLSNYPSSLSRQFSEMNSNGRTDNDDYSFGASANSSLGNINQAVTNNNSYNTSKYSYNEKDYYSNASGAGTTKIEAPKNQSAKVLLTNKNGKKATEVSDTSVTLNNAQENKKSNKKDKDKTKDKKKNLNLKSSDNATANQSENTELYLKANELLAQNQYQQVIDLLGKINPPTLRSLTSIASCYNALGNTDAAIDYYNRADKISPDNSQILFSLAYLYFSKNEVEKAKNYLNQSLKIDPNNTNALQLKSFMSQQASNDDMNKAISYMNSGNYTDSKKILDKLAEKDSSNFQVYYYLGHICYATQKYADAVQDFLKAIKLNSEYALSYYSLGLAYDKLKKFNDSLASYERFVQMSTDDNKYTQYAKTRINTIKAKK